MWSSVRFLILGSVQVAACDATHRSHDSSSICASLQVINSTTMQRLAVADNPDKICLTNVLLWFIFLQMSCGDPRIKHTRHIKQTRMLRAEAFVHLSGLLVVALHFI